MAKVAVSENSLTVLNYLKENAGADLTAKDIAEALGMEVKSVNGIVTSGLQRKGYAERIPANVQKEDGTYETIKLIKATDAGLNYDHAAATKADADAAAAAVLAKAE